VNKIEILAELFSKIGLEEYKALSFNLKSGEEIIVRSYIPIFALGAIFFVPPDNYVSFKKW